MRDTTTYSATSVTGPCLETLEAEVLFRVHAALTRVSGLLFQMGAGERLVRLSRSDLVETLLVKALQVICADDRYAHQSDLPKREAFISIHLESALAAWLTFQAQTVRETRALKRCSSALLDPLS